MARALETDPINQLEENLQCTVCLEVLTDPRTLPCCHSFCKDCLEGIVKTLRVKTLRGKAPRGRPIREFPCPYCRTTFILDPDKHVADMPRNHFICNMVKATAVLDRGIGVPCSHNCSQSYSVARCVTCEKFLCRECLTVHNSYRGHSGHSVLTMEELSKPENRKKINDKMYCNEHSGMELKVYCETCDQLICKDCMDFKHVKQGHSCFLVKDVASNYKELLASNNKAMEDALTEGNAFVQRLTLTTKQLDRDTENIKTEIAQRKESVAKKVLEMLDQKAESLCKKLDEIHKGKRANLDRQAEETKLYVENIKTSAQLSKKLVDQGTEEEIISSQKMMLDNANNLLTNREEYFKAPVPVAKLSYTSSTGKEPINEEILRGLANSLGEVNEGNKDRGQDGNEKRAKTIYDEIPTTPRVVKQSSVISSHAIHHLEQTKEPDEFTISLLFLRYIMAYHYEVFQKLESVCKVISFEVKSKTERNLKLTPREDVDPNKFSKTVDKFICFYQDQNQNMHLVDIAKLPKDKMDVLSEARTKFSVVIDSAQELDKITIYGKKDKVEETKRFFQSKVGVLNPDSGSFDLSENLKLVVYQGDLTKENVDAIVNPSNDHLQHNAGTALAIVNAGGRLIQDESDDIMRKRGKHPLQPGEVELTAGGQLPCNFVVHAVSPVWKRHPPNTAMTLLYNAVINSLNLACRNGARSISIPAISSGLYKGPVDVCARVLFDAVVYFASKADKSTPLEEIHFVNIESSTNRTFVQEMENRFGGSIKREKVEASLSKDTKEQEKQTQIGQRQMGFTTANSGTSSDRGQTTNVTCRGSSHNNHSGDNKGGRPSDDVRPPLSYREAVCGKKTDRDHGPKSGVDDKTSKDDECSICLREFTKQKTLDKCGHSFCTKCIDKAFKVKKQCPICYMVYGPLTGNQPKGNMHDIYQSTFLPGFKCSGSLVISYSFLKGTQGADHPNPGKPYQGTSRTAYLPNNQEGKKVLKLLRKAFDQKLTFTIGRSTTTGKDDCVIWNDIHHKTSIYGGPTNDGYPDPDYLRRVQDELAAKGITE